MQLSQIEKSSKIRIFIDYSNLKSSVKYLSKYIDLKVLYGYLHSLRYVKKISFYYGTDSRNPKSTSFIKWVKKTGFHVVTKRVKYIRVDIKELILEGKNKRLLEKLDSKTRRDFISGIEKLVREEKYLEAPKCNLDIEIALDMFQSIDSYDGVILFSGDGDFESIIRILRSSGKRVYIVSLRKFLAGELIKNCDGYINITELENIPGLFYSPTK